jgi:hypothetical protein
MHTPKFQILTVVYDRMKRKFGVIAKHLEKTHEGRQGYLLTDYIPVNEQGQGTIGDTFMAHDSELDPVFTCKVCKEMMPRTHEHIPYCKAGGCFDCYHWDSIYNKKNYDPDNNYYVRLDNGDHYIFDKNRPIVPQSSTLGCGGQLFTIEFYDTDTFVQTNNLWCQGQMPKYWQDKYPPNAYRHYHKSLTHEQIQQAKACGLDPVAGFGGGIVVPRDRVAEFLKEDPNECILMCYDYGKYGGSCSEDECAGLSICIHWNGVCGNDFMDEDTGEIVIGDEYQRFELWP